jgi:hypothetical protein
MITLVAGDPRIPPNAARLFEQATDEGHRVVVTHASWTAADGRDRESLAIRILINAGGKQGRLVGVWTDRKFDVGLCLSRRLSFRELRQLVARPIP